jgi:hypothetical protein
MFAVSPILTSGVLPSAVVRGEIDIPTLSVAASFGVMLTLSP